METADMRRKRERILKGYAQGLNYSMEESAKALCAAVVIQALKDISTEKKRNIYWREVWASLSELASIYKMSRGELVLRAVSTGAIEMTSKELELRGVAETEDEQRLLEKYKKEGMLS